MKDIPGYEGEYAATSCGKVWSHKSKRFLKQRLNKDGYPRVTLSKDGQIKTWFVHRLVAMTYIPNPEEKETVNHKSEIKTQNNIQNLEWMTRAENVLYGTRTERAIASGAGKSKIPVKCVETGVVYPSIKEAAAAVNMCDTNISACCKHKPKFKTCGGYHWEYAEEVAQ